MNFKIIYIISLVYCAFSLNTTATEQTNNHHAKNNLIYKTTESDYFTYSKIIALNSKENQQEKLKVIVEFYPEPLIKSRLSFSSSKNNKVSYTDKLQSQLTLITNEQNNVLKSVKLKGIAQSYKRQFNYLYNGASLTIDKSKLSELKRISGVKKVHIVRDKAIQLHDSTALIQADQVWNIKDNSNSHVTGKGVKVAILDTGIDYTRTELGGCFGVDCRVVDGYDFMNDDDDPMDDQGHGTHVAGIVAANGEIKGVAPDTTLYAYKICDYLCPTDGTIAALEKAIDPDGDPSTDDGVDIINMSIGGPGGLDDPLTVAVNNLADENVLVVISAGNEGDGAMTVTSPGNASRALTVASTDKNDNIASYSSRGPILSETFQKPEISAPGSDIYSLAIGSGNVSLSGTSMAAPHVAGAAALVKQRYPELTGQEIKRLLINNTDSIDYPFATAGSGRLNVLAAVEANIVTNKNYLLFDRLDRTQGIWSNQQSIEIKNISQAPITISASINNDDSAIRYTFDEVIDTELVLDAGETKLITVNVEITVANLSNTSDLIHRADLIIVQDSVETKVPLLVFDAIKLQWQSENYPLSVWINSLDGGSDSLKEYVNHGGLYVNSGNYVISAVFDEPEQVSWVVKMLTVEDADINVEITENDAVNEIKVTSFTDHLGSNREQTSLYGSAIYMEFTHPESLYRHAQFFNGWTNDIKNGMFVTKPVYVSSFSDEFELNYSFMYGDIQSSSDDYHLYTYTGSHSGLSDNVDIALDGQLQSKISFEITAPEIFGGEYLWYLYSNLDADNYHTSGWYTSGSGISGPRDMLSNDEIQYLDKAFTFTIHGNNQANKRLGKYAFSLTQIGDRINDINIQEVSFDHDTNSLMPAKDLTENRSYKISAEGLYTDISLYNYNNRIWASHYLTSDLYSQYSNDLIDSTTVDCDNAIKYQQTEEFWSTSFSTDIVSQCEQSNFQIFHPNYLFGVKHQSKTSLSIPSNGENYSFQKINLQKLLEYNKDKEQTYTATTQLFTHYASLDDVEVFAFINYLGNWEPIEVNLTSAENGRTDVELVFPILSEPYVTSLKLSYKVYQYEGMTLISNAFVLGGTKDEIMLIDRDEDGIVDGIDDDKDNDGIPDGVELSHGLNPFDASDALEDLDGDGTSNLNEYIEDRLISLIDGNDRDEDGVVDYLDAFPDDPTEAYDTDGDGIGNNADTDDDNDSVDDEFDVFPLDPNESLDTDNDGIGNNADSDDDNDGVEDEFDVFPLDPYESEDTDNDGIGNNADLDDDNDGIDDDNDHFPYDPTESQDTDLDGIGNNADTDDDGDGIEDINDAFPLDANESLDTDNDGIGNNADTDDDGDGVSDTNDAYPLDSSRSTNVTNNANSDKSSGSSGGSFYFLIVLLLLILERKTTYYNRYK